MSEKIWFIGDTHFFHKNVIPYCGRPFGSVEEMNETLIHNWNSVVAKEDRVIVNGDFALCGKDKIIEIGQRLKGRKTLLIGNHDGASLKTYYEAGFEMVSKDPIVVEEFFIVSHMPQQFMSDKTPYVYFYAHVHNSEMYQTITKRSVCLSCERWNYTPIEFEEIIKEMRKLG